MTTAQAPTVPTPSELAILDPVVAVALLATITVVALLVFLGPAIRDRITTKPGSRPAPTQTGTIPPALPAAVQRASGVTDDYIASLKEQLVFLRSQLADRDRELDGKDREIQRLNERITDLLARGGR